MPVCVIHQNVDRYIQELRAYEVPASDCLSIIGMRVYVLVCLCVSFCVRVGLFVCWSVCVYACMGGCVLACTHTCVYACIHIYMYVRMHVVVCVYI